MRISIRSGSSCLLKLVGIAAGLGGLSLGAAALLAEADASVQVLMGLIAMAGLLIALVGGAILGLGALLGRGRAKPAAPTLSPEEQQRRDSREFLAGRSGEE